MIQYSMDIEDEILVQPPAKVDGRGSPIKGKGVFYCFSTADQSDFYKRLPNHLASKIHTNDKTECTIHLSPEYPNGTSRDQCSTCLTKNRIMCYMDADVLVEVKGWLDEEQKRGRALAAAYPDFWPVSVDKGAEPGSARKRSRLTLGQQYDEEDEGTGRSIKRGNIARSSMGATPFRTTTSGQDFNEDTSPEDTSDFLQQAARLVQASNTMESQIESLQWEIKVANDTRQDLERKLKATEGTEQRLKGLEDSLAAALEREQATLERAEAAEQDRDMAKASGERLRDERDRALEHCTTLAGGDADKDARVKKAEEESRLAKGELEWFKEELEAERQDHAKKTEQLDKLKARMAAVLHGH